MRPALVMAAWTFLVWTTRIRNVWADDELSSGEQVFRTALALVFTGFAAVIVAAWFRSRRHGGLRPWVAPWIRAFAFWTVAVWGIRGVQIALAGHSMVFVLVHAVLAVVSIALAVWSYRSVSVEASPLEPVAA